MRGLGGEEEGILGYQQTGQITLQTSAGEARCQVATFSSMCSSTTHLLRPLLATTHRETVALSPDTSKHYKSKHAHKIA